MAETSVSGESVPIDRIADIMEAVGVWWAVAGGWAIDLWLGARTRDHHDVEVVVLRTDQAAVRLALGVGWVLSCLDPPGSGWRPWHGHAIEPPAFQLQAQSLAGQFDLFLETADSTSWRYRRDEAVTRALQDVTTHTGQGIPVMRPEVQLLYMAKSNEPKNARDFAVAVPRLDPDARAWLHDALAHTHPGHSWLARFE